MWLSVRQAAFRLGVTPRVIYNYIKNGDLPIRSRKKNPSGKTRPYRIKLDDLKHFEKTHNFKRRHRPIAWEKQGDCLICTSHSTDSDGYLRIYVDGKSRRLTHVMYEQTTGKPFPQGHVVIHSCGNRSCIRLSHLKYIPRSAASQYYPHGQGHHNSVLTEALVIRSRQDKSSTHREFARAHGLGKHVNAIAAARTGQTWKYLSDKYPPLDVDFTPRGEKHPFAKLTEEDVAKILSNKHKVSAAVLAKQYGVSVRTIYSIWNGKSWKHVHPNSPNGSGGGCDG